MAAPTALSAIDPQAASYQANSSMNSTYGTSTFDKVLGGISYGAGLFGPAVAEGVYAGTGNYQSASIVSAAFNAAAGGSGMSGTMGLSTSGSLGTTGAGNYLSGGSTAYSTTSTGTNVDSIIDQSYANQTYLLAVQSELGMIQTQTTSLSNAINVKDSAMRSVINNFRVG